MQMLSWIRRRKAYEVSVTYRWPDGDHITSVSREWMARDPTDAVQSFLAEDASAVEAGWESLNILVKEVR